MPTEQIAEHPAQIKAMKTLKVFGTSDDLVELRGAINDEFCVIDKPLYIRFTNGALVFALYGSKGEWGIALQEPGSARVVQCFLPGQHNDEEAPDYSGLLVIEAEEWKVDATSNTPPALAGPRLRAARDIMYYLQDKHDLFRDVDAYEVNEAIAEFEARIPA